LFSNDQLILFSLFCLFKFLHAHYVLLILHELRRLLKRLPNVNIVSTHQTTFVTVVGDLHGSLADLLVIFHKVNSTFDFLWFFFQWNPFLT